MSTENSQHRSMEEFLERPAWEERYGGADAVWSGRPNPQLVADVTALPPGRALEVGCGEGADAIWLARQGWRVTAVDFAAAGLARAAQHADQAGAEIADRIDWVRADIRESVPAGPYDLVSAQFIHLPAEPRAALLRRLADVVAPGGVLLFVAHHPDDMRTVRHDFPVEMFATAEELAPSFDPAEWVVEAAEARARATDHPDHGELVVHDAVLRVRRRPDDEGAAG